MAICKLGICKWDILKHPIFNILNFRGLIKFIYDKITLIYCVENEFNPTFEVHNIASFANGRFPNGGFYCLCTVAGTPMVKSKGDFGFLALFVLYRK